MRNIGIVAFGITVGILAPAALMQLDAGKHQREMLFAPGSESAEINGAKVTATVDKKMVDRGDTVHVKLVSDKRVAVGVVVFGSSGNEGDRVPDPPTGVAHESITLEPNKAQTIAVKLTGARTGYEMSSYTIYVTSEKGGDRLAKLQRKAGPSIPTGEIPRMDGDTEKLFSALYAMNRDDSQDDGSDQSIDEKLYSKNKVARLHVFARTPNPDLAIKVPDTATADAAFPVTVAIKNPTNKKLTVKLELDTPRLDDSYLGVPVDTIHVDGETDSIVVPKGQTKKVTVNVTASEVGVLGLQARVECVEYDRTCSKLYRSAAFDAVQINAATPAVAAK